MSSGSGAVDRAVGVALVTVVTLCTVALAFFAALLVPLRIGAVLVPVAIPLAMATVWLAPAALARADVPRIARAVPYIAWFATILILSQGTSQGDALLPGGGSLAAVSYGVILGGGLVGPLALVLPDLRVKSRP